MLSDVSGGIAKGHHMQQRHHMVQFYPNRSEQEEAFRQKDQRKERGGKGEA